MASCRRPRAALIAIAIWAVVLGSVGLIIMTAILVPDWSFISVYLKKPHSTEEMMYERQYGVAYPPRTCNLDEFRCLGANDDGLLRRESADPETPALYKVPCIPLNWKCDGIRDCSNGEDEELCCPDPGDYTCATRAPNISIGTAIEALQCVSMARLCDGKNDCPQGDDEYCNTGCKSDNVCINQCDGNGLGYTCNCDLDWRLTKDGNIDCKLSFNATAVLIASVALFAMGGIILYYMINWERRRELKWCRKERPDSHKIIDRGTSYWDKLKLWMTGRGVREVPMTANEVRAWVKNILWAHYKLKPVMELDGDTFVSQIMLPMYFSTQFGHSPWGIGETIKAALYADSWKLPVPDMPQDPRKHAFRFVKVFQHPGEGHSFATFEHTNPNIPRYIGQPRDPRANDSPIEHAMYTYVKGDGAKRPMSTAFCWVCADHFRDRTGCHCKPCAACTLRDKIDEMNGCFLSGMMDRLSMLEITNTWPARQIPGFLYGMIQPAPLVELKDILAERKCEKKAALDYMTALPDNPNVAAPGSYCPGCKKGATSPEPPPKPQLAPGLAPTNRIVAGKIYCGELNHDPQYAMDVLHAMAAVHSICQQWKINAIWEHVDADLKRCREKQLPGDFWRTGELKLVKPYADVAARFTRPGYGWVDIPLGGPPVASPAL